MKLNIATAIMMTFIESVSWGACVPSQCIPGQGCTWTSQATRVCTNSNMCQNGTIHNVVTYALCDLGRCNAGCVLNMCAQNNNAMSCHGCNQITNTDTGKSCGFSPPPACSDDPSCSCGSDLAAPGPGLCPCLSCGLTTPGTTPPTVPPTVPPTAPSTVPPTTVPPIGPCGPAQICGDVNDTETNSVSLVSIPVEIRNDRGQIIATTHTDAAGHYTYTPLAPGDYFIRPVPNRTENLRPNYRRVTAGTGVQADFSMMFVPAEVTVQGEPGTFLLFTPFAFTGTIPPPMPGPTQVISQVINLDNVAKVHLPGNISWWLTCWEIDYQGSHKLPTKPVPGPILAQKKIGPILCK